MPCKVIVNADSGNYANLDLNKVLQYLGCVDTEIQHINSKTDWNAEGYDTVLICGGDGTLHNAIEKCQNKQIIYVPCGTLNEAAKTNGSITSVGKANNEHFSYVCATGSFTEIGYSAKNKNKQRFKSLAYFPEVVKNYRHYDIRAHIDVDGKIIDGNFTLLMILKSYRCFGFSFNNSYKQKEGLYLLAIRSFGKDTLINRAKMFFPFFQVFFCGVKKPCEKTNWLLTPFNNLSITFDEKQTFCIDGEKRVFDKTLNVSQQTLKKEIIVIKTPLLKCKKFR